MNENRVYVRTFIGLVLVVGLAVIFLGRPEVTPSDMWQASSYNAAPAGNLGLYRTLERTGWRVARWRENYPKLGGTDQVMLVTETALGRDTPFSEDEISRLLDWVRHGNRVVLLGDFAGREDMRPFFDALDIHIPETSPTTLPFLARSGQLLGAGRSRIELSGPGGPCIVAESYPLPSLPAGAEVLLRRDSMPYAARLPLGRGSVWLVATASLIDNEFLPLGHNLDFTLAMLQPGGRPARTVWFEEAHHGYRSGYAVTGLAKEPGLTLALAQMALGLLVFVLSQFHRFGQILPLYREENRSSLDFVRSMALIYRRANLRNEIVRDLYEETRARVIERLNLPPDADNALIARRLRALHPHLANWKKLAERYDSDKFVQGLPPGGWLQFAQDLARIKREMM